MTNTSLQPILYDFQTPLIYTVGGGYDNPSDDIQATVAELDRLNLICNGIEWGPQNILFKDVGGFEVWDRLLGNLKK